MLFRKSTLMNQFTIRDMFWLLVVVGLSVSWAVDHARNSVNRRRCEFWAVTAKVFADVLREEGYRVDLNEELGVRAFGKLESGDTPKEAP
jgi:hypothetical protein